MHNHNDQTKGHKSMVWMMIPCLLLLAFLFISGSNLAGSRYFWLLIVGVCIVPHVWMLFKRKNRAMTENSTDSSIKQPETTGKNKHKHGGCCH